MDNIMLVPTHLSVVHRVTTVLHRNCWKMVVLGSVTILSIIVILFSSISFSNSAIESTESDNFDFHKLINRDIDPCVDFYSYCCSKWIRNQESEGDEAFVTQFNLLQKKVIHKLSDIVENITDLASLPSIVQRALRFYSSCKNPILSESSFEPLLSFFKFMGGWPILDGTIWDKDNFSWIKASAVTLRTLEIETFIGFYVTANSQNTSQNLILIAPPKINGSPSTSLSLLMLQLIIETLNNNVTYDKNFYSDLKGLIQFQDQLFSLIKPMDDLNILMENTEMSILELEREIPQVNWLSFIQVIINSSVGNFLIQDSSKILVHNLKCLQNIVNFLESKVFSLRTIANYIGGVVAQELYILIPNAFESYTNYFGLTLKEVSERRKEICFEKCLKNFGLALDYLYVKNNSDFDQAESSKLISYIKNAFKKNTLESQWLDDTTKIAAIHKLNMLIEIIGYPAILGNETELDKLYEDFPEMSWNTLQNYFQMCEFFHRKIILQLWASNQREELLPPRPVSQVAAYYMPDWNVLVYPLSMHNKPFYQTAGPWYLNFGAIGSVIGHEIIHGFDNIGSKRDGVGTLHNWWKNSSYLEYTRRALCFKTQFDAYKINETGPNLNGTRGLGENIADSGGLRQAYLAYQLWQLDNGEERPPTGLEDHSPEQLFFISFASVWCTKMSSDMEIGIYSNDAHSPPRFRVFGSVSNSEDFAKAFNCPRGSPMNPQNKCSMW